MEKQLLKELHHVLEDTFQGFSVNVNGQDHWLTYSEGMLFVTDNPDNKEDKVYAVTIGLTKK